MVKNILLVGVGGMVGSVARYLISLSIINAFPSAFPYGTFAVNVAGCLAIGAFFGLSERFDWLTPDLRLLITTGFCGGFTTFSAFAYESLLLLQNKDYFTFAAYSILSFVMCLLGAGLGLYLTRG
jgi:CrcB protein